MKLTVMDFFNDLFRYPLSHPYLLAPLVFVLGAIVGSLLNVCILRLPLEKSIFWPGSHCGNCLKGIWLRDNVPILSYLRLKGRCRHCGAKFSSRYMWIEILTGLLFAVTFVYYVTLDLHGSQGTFVNPFAPSGDAGQLTMGVGPWNRLALLGMWAAHSVLLCCLLVTTFTDLDYQEIPLRITIFGTVAGILLSLLMPWPWPADPQTLRLLTGGFFGQEPLPSAMQFWPWWLPHAEGVWSAPYSWQMGLVNSLLGAALGTGVVRGIRFVFGWGFGKEAMGLGDADLMMMIGAFLGWQATILVLIYAVFLGIGYALYAVLFNRDRLLPFGPFIAGGVLLLLYAPAVIASFGGTDWLRDTKRGVQFLFFFNALAVTMIGALSVVLAFTMSFALRLFRLVRLAPVREPVVDHTPKPRPVPVAVSAPVSEPPPAPVVVSAPEEAKPIPSPSSPAPTSKGKKKRKK